MYSPHSGVRRNDDTNKVSKWFMKTIELYPTIYTVSVIEICDLEFICNLVLVIWLLPLVTVFYLPVFPSMFA